MENLPRKHVLNDKKDTQGKKIIEDKLLIQTILYTKKKTLLARGKLDPIFKRIIKNF